MPKLFLFQDLEPDPILRSEQSAHAIVTDALQVQVVAERQTMFQFLFWGLVIVEAVLWYFNTPAWILVAVPMAWLGLAPPARAGARIGPT